MNTRHTSRSIIEKFIPALFVVIINTYVMRQIVGAGFINASAGSVPPLEGANLSSDTSPRSASSQVTVFAPNVQVGLLGVCV